ncbi:MAG: hypothetical protein QM718_04480 [Steroidobacteraceae bacterium]
MKRRAFIWTGVGVTTALLAGFGAEVFSEHEIAAAVRRRLSFLHLDEQGPKDFARDSVAALLAKRPTWLRIKARVRTMFAKGAPRWGFSSDQRTRWQRQEDHFATLFLLSSDFFTHGADESRTIRYVALYDPMLACGNPFRRPV